jgi:5-methyltetrahydrofolate--homocysteine methyltransferase
MADLEGLQAAVEAGDRGAAVALTTSALERGVAPAEILASMTAAMAAVGGRFAAGEAYVPELLVSARAMKSAMVVLEPILTAAGIRPEHTAVIGTIRGDLHDIGKNLVAMMWRGAGIKVIDLGTDAGPDAFVAAAREHEAALVGISALLTTTMTGMRDVVAAVRAELPGTGIVIGGAPVTAAFARQIGADGYAPDAATAVAAAQQVIATTRASRALVPGAGQPAGSARTTPSS